MTEQFKGHVRQRKNNNLLTKWEPRPHWKIIPYKNLFLLPIGPYHSHKLPTQKLQKLANNLQISTLDSKQNLTIGTTRFASYQW